MQFTSSEWTTPRASGTSPRASSRKGLARWSWSPPSTPPTSPAWYRLQPAGCPLDSTLPPSRPSTRAFAGSARRVRRGHPPVHRAGWIPRPADPHRLVRCFSGSSRVPSAARFGSAMRSAAGVQQARCRRGGPWSVALSGGSLEHDHAYRATAERRRCRARRQLRQEQPFDAVHRCEILPVSVSPTRFTRNCDLQYGRAVRNFF
jgi:hypothetical protein